MFLAGPTSARPPIGGESVVAAIAVLALAGVGLAVVITRRRDRARARAGEAERHRVERERRGWERRVTEAQRLNSLGVLAGGIAHDFNNLLMVIQGASDELAASAPGAPAVSRLRAALHRASALTRQLLVYAGREALEPVATDLSALVRELAPCLAPGLPPNVALSVELAPEPVGVRVDAARIGQLVFHLVSNATEAIDDKEGTIVLETGHARTGDGTLSAQQWHAVPSGERWAFLRVKDDGAGIDPLVVERIFEPFFSTHGAGRGMGLAAVRGIVLSHRGYVRVESTPAHGSAFTILLPPADAPARPEPATEVARESESDAAAGASAREPRARAERGAVLLVDDDEGVREVTARMLRRQGYGVREAHDGPAALRCLDEDPGAILCALLDLTMPGWNGIETMHALRRRRPDLPVLLISGYSTLEIDPTLPNGASTRVLHKPFTLQELETRLDALLGTSE